MKHSPEGELLTSIILGIFKLNGLLLIEGDKITKEFDLSSARWKVLGALYVSEEALTVPDIARLMGQTRQAVQRIANEMKIDGLLKAKENPNHKSAKLLVLTPKGQRSFKKIDEKQIPWVNSLASDINFEDLQQVSSLIRLITNKIDS